MAIEMSDDGTFVVPGTGGWRLACRATACGNRDCNCTDVTLQVVPIDDRVRKVRFANGQLHFDTEVLDDGSSAIDQTSSRVVRVDVESGVVHAEDGSVAALDPQIVWLSDSLDGDGLDALQRMRLRAKGYHVRVGERRDDIDLPADSTTVSWEAVHLPLRSDVFALDDHWFDAIDLHCIGPGCTCREAVLWFQEADEGPLAGAVRINLTTGRHTLEPDTLDGRSLAGLWRAYRRRYPGLERLVARRADMRAFAGDRVVPVAPVVAQPGRNDPCWCGSGRKFKKCHLDAVVTRLPT